MKLTEVEVRVLSSEVPGVIGAELFDELFEGVSVVVLVVWGVGHVVTEAITHVAQLFAVEVNEPFDDEDEVHEDMLAE